MKRIVVIFACAFLVGALEANAQVRTISLTPYAGAFDDNTFRGDTFENGQVVEVIPDPALLIGVRAAAHLGGRFSAFVDVGYSEMNDVGASGIGGNHYLYGRDHLLTTIGVEYTWFAQRAGIGVELAAGSHWIRGDVEGKVGSPTPDVFPGGEFGANFTVVPGVQVDLVVHRNVSVVVQGRDFFIPERGTHNVAFNGGVRWSVWRRNLDVE